jgi:hypothetical protein
MTRVEYLEMLATEPATPMQVGAIMGEFDRLGVADRAERLALSAELLGLDELDSTTDLMMGEAGRLVGILRSTRDRVELPDVSTLDDDGQDDEHGDASDASGDKRVTIADLIGQVALVLWQVFGAVPEPIKPGIPEGSIPDDRD